MDEAQLSTARTVTDEDRERDQLNRYPILRYFGWKHLPPQLQVISQPFAEMARDLVTRLPSGPEVSACLRKLLEAKDCAVRAAL